MFTAYSPAHNAGKMQLFRTATSAMKRTPERARQTRESLLHAALDVFDKRGVARASMEEIARAAGVTRGALYWHFKSREDLFDALFQHLFQEFGQQLGDNIRSASPDMLGNLRRALLGCFERLECDETICKSLRVIHLKCEHSEDNAAITALLRRYKRMWLEQMHAALTLCVRQGALPGKLDVDAASLYLRSLLFGLLHLRLQQPAHAPMQQQAARIIDAALDTLRASVALQRSDAP